MSEMTWVGWFCGCTIGAGVLFAADGRYFLAAVDLGSGLAYFGLLLHRAYQIDRLTQ